ncbi:ribosome biogenesis GTPase Der [Rhodoplanes roseus]|uniref:GTPase Der n=1 Tax=Rhodoplanes roseus TaxID=29409 RepID=A0A327L5I4_9BRAD|nr:ribosome biogenesis GTPase Der [Rhodoplanes roseus]RAI45143.1 ribosome biogenesis GTPase Der [Rhodoplanes roseus]
MSFTIAIVGRPNVGKSTLFNRLVGKRIALVDDQPGVTRDRREGTGRLGDLDFTVIDTAGFEEAAIESLAGRMRAQTETAMAQADAILFLIDARAGLTPMDRAFAAAVRKIGRPVVLVANKSEGRQASSGVYEAFGLGLGEPVGVSAEHGEGLSDLYDALREALPEETRAAAAATKAEVLAEREAKFLAREAKAAGEEPVDPGAPTRPIRMAVVGRPNAGKSTLINRLLGTDRLLTGPEAGITRDAIAVDLDWGGRAFQVHDTAGMRRKSKIDDKLEKMSVSDGLEAIRFAEVVVLLMDATAPFEEQDLRIADLVEREGRALVLGLSKWDLAEGEAGALTRLRDEVGYRLPQLAGLPVVAVSGLTGAGLDRLMQAVIDIHAIWNRRIATHALNRWLDGAIGAHPPPAVSGRRLKLNYITQPKARPPSFVVFCTRADAVPESYKRYLINGLRESFDLPGTPIRLTLREKNNPYATRAKGR